MQLMKASSAHACSQPHRLGFCKASRAHGSLSDCTERLGHGSLFSHFVLFKSEFVRIMLNTHLKPQLITLPVFYNSALSELIISQTFFQWVLIREEKKKPHKFKSNFRL